MLESKIERHHRERVEGEGGELLKLQPLIKGMPDRLMLRPIPPEHREIVAKYVTLVEMKQAGKPPKKIQRYWHARFHELGYNCIVVDSTGDKF
jgi:hypothetical protein